MIRKQYIKLLAIYQKSCCGGTVGKRRKVLLLSITDSPVVNNERFPLVLVTPRFPHFHRLKSSYPCFEFVYLSGSFKYDKVVLFRFQKSFLKIICILPNEQGPLIMFFEYCYAKLAHASVIIRLDCTR